jgi:DNA-binding MarR family transcriptional regulator
MADDGTTPEVRWLSADQLQDWVALMALLMTLPASLDAQLKQDAGINSFEYHVLVGLAETPEHMRVMSDLAAQARGSLSRLSHAVSRLEAAGWVERRLCGGAGRRTEVHLTAEGWQALQRIAPTHVAEARRLVVDALSADELKALGSAARRIVGVAAPDVLRSLPMCGD